MKLQADALRNEREKGDRRAYRKVIAVAYYQMDIMNPVVRDE